MVSIWLFLYRAANTFPYFQRSQILFLISMDETLHPNPCSFPTIRTETLAKTGAIGRHPLFTLGGGGACALDGLSGLPHPQPSCTRRPARRRRRARNVTSVFEKSPDAAAVSSILLSESVAGSCTFSVVALQALSPSAWTVWPGR